MEIFVTIKKSFQEKSDESVKKAPQFCGALMLSDCKNYFAAVTAVMWGLTPLYQ